MTEQYKPEIGEYCEVFLTSNVLGDRWVKVKCVGHDANGIIWRNGNDTQSYLYAELDNVREHKSEYNLFKETFLELFDEGDRIFYYEVAELLWREGYRKVE